ncbi:hypothetical protein A3I18_02490 [Candidatus Campbellbacteria bacterium RIFCSPLOWO2_02_FULL_35_11]|uniref:Uncharacterized protein n=2 Tax=Candidatus Campbelliibacteriota TaxID=1752727 RepID=A0A1F5ELF1_9BACT|nr:MAG: hypothetical protein A3E89_02765 [Candidatus Campbellbacteria bacterium RIFCSPHIGHO2_12_FULL_35_10]OGD70739.1 MAG: hypothetical protein A3I18_02490 [Candidatus Campbellbacteria bacterium RIFCSPLOWO2_02_FULL_35_11]
MNIFLKSIKEIVENNKIFFIVYYGTSTTSFDHVFPNWGEIIKYVLRGELENFVDYKQAHWNLQTFNRGLSGASSKDLLIKIDDFVLETKPNMVFVGVGDNDYFYNIDKEITKKNTTEIINKLLDKNLKVVFTTAAPSLNENLNKEIIEYIEIDREVAKQFLGNDNFVFVDLFELFPKNLLDKSYTLISPTGNTDAGYGPGELDYIHYNKFGNAVVAKILLKKVFDIDFDHEKFLKDLEDNTKKYPDY